MSYSRWQDERFWPLFRLALLDTHPEQLPRGAGAEEGPTTPSAYYQGIGRYQPDQAYARVADLRVLANLLGDKPFLFGDALHSTDAGTYGFLANSWFFAIDTPLCVHRLKRQPRTLLRAHPPAGDRLTAQNCTPLVSAPSMTRFVPVVKLEAGLARNTTPRATSSAVAMRPVGLRSRACLNSSGLLFSIHCQMPPSK